MPAPMTHATRPLRRRILGAALASAWLPASRSTLAQAAGKVWRVGVLESIPEADNAANLAALRKGFASLGYVEGRNLVIDYRSSDGRAERFPALADELVRARADLIVTRGTPATRAARDASTRVPVVMATMGDPRAIVASLAQPGGSVTGLTTFSTELTAKRLTMLKELAPGVTRVALLHNMGNPAAAPEWDETQAAARALGIQADHFDVRTVADLDAAFDAAARSRVDAIIVGLDGFMQMHRRDIVERAARRRLPAAYPSREFVEAGGLFAYAVNYPELYYRFASYADRIFKGAKPGDLPIERPTRFELVINEGAARALGLDVPRSLRVQADEVIR
jgi:putative ABC transport system substrate-binding protein